jgi:hypothetical protein
VPHGDDATSEAFGSSKRGDFGRFLQRSPKALPKDSRQQLSHWYLRRVTRELSEITEKALRLPQGEQLKLARTLLERSEASGDSGVDAAWEQEIERRIEMIDAGLAKGRPFAEVVRDIDRQLGR